MIRPELFRFEYCNVTIGRSGREFGRTIVSDCGTGKVRIASDVFVLTAEKEIVDRIVAVERAVGIATVRL